MNRRLSIMAMAITAGFGVATANADTTMTVGPTGDFTTIQSALDFAAAQPTDNWTFNVAPGTYAENVNFNAGNYGGVKLVGTGPGVIVNPASGAGITFNRGGASAAQPLALQNITVTAPTSNGVLFSNAAMSHFSFNGLTAVGNGANGIRFGNAGVLIDDVTVKSSTISFNTAAGISTGSTASLTNMTVDSSSFTNNGQSHILINGGSANAGASDYHNLTIKDSTFGTVGATSKTDFSSLLWLKGSGNDNMDNWSITGNDFSSGATTLDTPSFPGQGNGAGILFHGRPGDTYSNLIVDNNTFTNTAGPTGSLWYGVKFDETGGTQYSDVVSMINDGFANLRIGAFSAEVGGTMLYAGANQDINTIPADTFTNMSVVDSSGLLVPEPTSLALLGLGALMLKRRRRAAN